MSVHDRGKEGEEPLPCRNPQEQHEATDQQVLSDSQRAIQNAQHALAAMQQQALLHITTSSFIPQSLSTPIYKKASFSSCPSKQEALVQMRIHLERCHIAPDGQKPTNAVSDTKHQGLASVKMPVLTRW